MKNDAGRNHDDMMGEGVSGCLEELVDSEDVWLREKRLIGEGDGGSLEEIATEPNVLYPS